eukprot:GEMP01017622.1.p1 GENE.GEMP01017622.1~~GEMP01017622.1.p1  ORF type:complete len:486 (+),score=118.54 GEMP01017622.1:44-1459(+)
MSSVPATASACACVVGACALTGSAIALHKVLKRLEKLEERASYPLNVLPDAVRTYHGDSLDAGPGAMGSPMPTAATDAIIKRILLTGGPCAGKTTALATVSDSLEGFGITVFCVPEASSMLFSSGYPYPTHQGPKAQFVWESIKLNLQKNLEDTFYQAARDSGKPAVILCDRGMADTKAYLQLSDDWAELLEKNRWTEEELYARYDAVVHLVTAAIGAEDFYSGENNVARREDVEEARALENRLREAWMGHPHVLHLTNEGVCFEDKMHKVVGFIQSQMNVNTEKNVGHLKQVFILEGTLPPLDDARVYNITSHWLKGYENGDDKVLRKRSKDGVSTYILCSRKFASGAVINGRKSSRGTYLQRRLSRQVYKEMLNQADPEYAPLNRKRYCFLDTFAGKETLFNLDQLEQGTLRLHIDHVDGSSGSEGGAESRLGGMRWIDVTHEEEFTLRALSLKRARMIKLSQGSKGGN